MLRLRRCEKCGGWDYLEDDHGWQTHCINCGNIKPLEKPVEYRRGTVYEAENTDNHPVFRPSSRLHISSNKVKDWFDGSWENNVMALER